MPSIEHAVAILSSFYDTVGPEKFSGMVTAHALPPEVEEAFGVVNDHIRALMPDGEVPDLCVIVLY